MKLKLPPGPPFPALRNLRAEYPRAAAQALNRAATSSRAAGVREVASSLSLKQKDVRAATRIQKAHRNKLAATILAVGKALPLIRFGARQVATGVRFQLGGELKLRVSAFIARMQSGHTGVFRRIGAKVQPIRGRFAAAKIQRGPRRGQPILRQPIKEQFGPSIPGTFEQERIVEKMEQVARERFPVEFRRSLTNIFRRGG